jgi:nitrogen fixation/metabolism regulation signal transduction histidine kinase
LCPSKIFNALYTTKRNEHTGEEIGTGLGMWLVDTIIKEYSGNVELLCPKVFSGVKQTRLNALSVSSLLTYL